MSDLGLKDLRIETFNYLLSFNFISILFTVFCILILVNGSNFLDGLNTLVIGYYSLVCFFLILLSSNFDLSINPNINLLLIFLLVLFPFNFFGKVYLGDSGSYLIGFSILRRFFSENKVDAADQYHLHQMIYNYLINKKIINTKYTNTFVASLINIYNFIIFICFYKFYSNTKILILVTLTNILIYLIIYFLMKTKNLSL